MSRIIKKVSRAKASLYNNNIKLHVLSENRILEVQRTFMQQKSILGVLSLKYCNHIPIISQGGGNAELFRNKKGYFLSMCMLSVTMNLN